MTFSIPYYRPTAPEFPARLPVEPAADAPWHQWIFKAPPLQVHPPRVDVREIGAALTGRAEPAR